ncbi:MAG: pantothenate kinase [Acidobacteria bacterium OLB17]|nr:MAG: pantothenate kinase [Acidobacteria bacterium OLB17]MCZ2390077.1 type III pantothenate kinase [Acidobacteriota bacterium]
MLLAVDIGNSAIKLGVFDDRDMLVERHVLDPGLAHTFAEALKSEINTAVISSVVPKLTPVVSEAIKKRYGIIAKVIANDHDLGIKVNYRPIEDAGNDRLVNSAAAAHFYGVPCIVISFGTATTVDVVSRDHVLLGGLIAPGVKMSAAALHEKTARLPLIDIEGEFSPTSETTETSIRSGVILSQIGLIEKVISQVEAKIGKPKVVATGGYAAKFAELCPLIDVVDRDLTLKGLCRIARGR